MTTRKKPVKPIEPADKPADILVALSLVDAPEPETVSVVPAKVAKLLKRGGPYSLLEQISIARMALRDIAAGPRSELRDIAVAALKVCG